MAIAKEIWDKARILFESGQLSLSQISEKTGINKSSISKKAKIQQWKSGEHSDYIEAKEIIVEKKSTISTLEINTLDELAEERIRHKKLINDNATKLAAKLNTMTDQVDEPQDLKHLVEANDKLAITLKVADRHAPKTEINNTNATQNNTETKRVTIARRSDRTE